MDGSSLIQVVEIQGNMATIRLPDDSQEIWSLASLPSGVMAGDFVRLTVTDGDLEVELLNTPPHQP